VIELGPLPDVIRVRLLAKYETIAALRLARSHGEPHPPRAFFQALAAEFPGALKELDRLPPPLVRERALFLAGPDLDEDAPWLWPVAVYHAVLAEPDRLPWIALPGWLRAPAEPISPSRMKCGVLATARRLELSPDEVERQLFPWKP
jgi:hypothetical protein